MNYNKMKKAELIARCKEHSKQRRDNDGLNGLLTESNEALAETQRMYGSQMAEHDEMLRKKNEELLDMNKAFRKLNFGYDRVKQIDAIGELVFKNNEMLNGKCPVISLNIIRGMWFCGGLASMYITFLLLGATL